jgi:hypothetical protein
MSQIADETGGSNHRVEEELEPQSGRLCPMLDDQSIEERDAAIEALNAILAGDL